MTKATCKHDLELSSRECESIAQACVTAIRMHPLGDLKSNERNARRHGRAQLRKLAKSIREFGFNVPILIDANQQIVAGHARAEAARLAGLTTVPTIALEHLTPDQVRAFALADNKLAELATWDLKLLGAEFEALAAVGIDLEATGLDAGEIDIVFDQLDGEPDDQMDQDVRPAPDIAPISKSGDVWILGEHRLLCGDALLAESYDRLMGGSRADAVFVDLPYNVKIDGHVCGLGRVKHREFRQASGELSSAEFENFLQTAFVRIASFTRDGAVVFACIDWRHQRELLESSRKAGLHQLNLCVWSKTNAGMGSLYRSQHELIHVMKVGRAPHVNNVQLGRFGRHRSNVWRYAGVNTFRKGREEDLEAHPTVKPLALVADALKDVTKRGDLVLDPFVGSGTTILAAEKTSRRAAVIEIDPVYVDVAIDRWQKLTGSHARHAVTK